MTNELPESAEQPHRWLDLRQALSFVMPAVTDSPTSLVRVLRGEHMTTHEELFAEFASVLNFPDYFGGNWPALSDCLDDLEWLGDFDSLYLIIVGWPMVLQQAPKDLRVLCRILNEAGENWFKMGRDGTGDSPVSFRTTALG